MAVAVMNRGCTVDKGLEVRIDGGYRLFRVFAYGRLIKSFQKKRALQY